MYRVKTLDGTVLSVVDKVQYVKEQPNGAIIICDERAAQGIVAGDVLYHLEGLPAFGGRDTVTLEEFSASEYQEAYNILTGVSE